MKAQAHVRNTRNYSKIKDVIKNREEITTTTKNLVR